MTKDEKIKLVNSVSYWWHHIDLGDGIVTPGQEGCKTVDKLNTIALPQNLQGKRILDAGCADGFFSFECERRGAKVIAIDRPSADCKPGFEVAKKILDSKVEYITKDFHDVTLEELGKFDIVLFLDIVYHLRHPLKALEILRSLTNDLAIVQSYCMQEEKDRMMRLILPAYEGDHISWQFSIPCLERLMQEAGFKTEIINAWDTRVVIYGK